MRKGYIIKEHWKYFQEHDSIHDKYNLRECIYNIDEKGIQHTTHLLIVFDHQMLYPLITAEKSKTTVTILGCEMLSDTTFHLFLFKTQEPEWANILIWVTLMERSVRQDSQMQQSFRLACRTTLCNLL